MSGNLIDLFGEIKTKEDLQKFAQAQFEVIQTLTKQVEQLKTEKKHLEELLKTATPTVFADNDISDDEKIAKMQLRVLEGVSRDRELTLEEAKKVDTYHKIMANIKNQTKKQASPVDSMSAGELLQLVKNDPSTNS